MLASVLLVTMFSLTACGGSGRRGIVGAPSTTTSSSLTSRETDAIIYRPVAPDGSPTIHITSTADGRCWEGSQVVLHSEAWRCIDQNEILDPCYTAGYEEVVCPTQGPWTGKGVDLHLEEPLSSFHGNTEAGTSQPTEKPWALELTDGTRCIFAQGATSVEAGLRQNYLCWRGTERYPKGLSLFGEPERSPPLWTIYGGTESASQLTKHAIATAWF